MEKIFYVALLTVASACLVSGQCPAVCLCPGTPPRCPPGVSSVPDGCGCCKVCARQLNEDCGPGLPCDHHKGLECNYGNDLQGAHGICRAKLEGRTCEYNGRIYQNGESFQPSCKHQCSCIDGAVGCVPLCPIELPLSSPSCPTPRLVKLPGHCCHTLVCQEGVKWKPKTKVHPHKSLGTSGDEREGNELLEVGKSSEKHPGYKHLAAWRSAGGWSPVRRCVVQTTDWSPCSRTCGMGVSSRITNDNAQCKLDREARLCSVRPCGQRLAPLQKGKKCTRTQKAPEPLRLSYAGCRSARLFWPNQCGQCVDGRCCAPQRTRTLAVLFVCPDGERFERAVMMVQSCKCSFECGPLNDVALRPRHWLQGDTHKFAD
ncbi:CCN family member 1 [Lepisosteus oculatus]|uniref:CCN family member 1 n=1 Tax=Lepisosteus oculatus TaxID=7918 RepID=UPI0035F51C28